MRIAQISYHTCPLASEEGKETGGMNVYVLNLSLELARLGHKIDVFTRSEDPRAKKIVQVAPNFRVIHLPAGPEETLPKKELIEYIPEFAQMLHNFIDNEKIKYDIIHAHYYMSGMAVLQLLRTTNYVLHTVLSFHTLALLKNLVARSLAEAEPAVRVEAEMKLVATADKIISPSKTEYNYLQYFYAAHPDKIAIIPPGYNPNIFKPMDKTLARQKIGADPKHKIILYVGRIEPLKGLDVLMYALKILVQKCPDYQICVWIVGGEKQPVNPELQKLYELRDTLKLHSFIKFVGQQHQHELPFYYNAADVVVMPSHYESFGMSALEAMACGTPVVTTNVTGISTMFENNGHHTVISANNPIMLAQAIEKIISAAPSHLEKPKIINFTWEKMAKRMEQLYKLVINPH